MQLFVDASHHAAIQEPDATTVHHQQVAGMRIGMVEIVVEDHLQADGRPAPGNFVAVDARRRKPLRFRELDAFEHLHRQHAAGGKGGVGARKVRPWGRRGSRGRTAAGCAARGRSPTLAASPADIRPQSPPAGSCETRESSRRLGPSPPGCPCRRPLSSRYRRGGTFTTTDSPEGSRARCTCPIEAEAIASGSKSAKSSSIGRPSSASTSLRTTAGGSAGTLACNCCNSSANLTPTRSGRVLRIWPSLMNVGPSSAAASRRPRFPGVPRDRCAAPRLEQVFGKIRAPSARSTPPAHTCSTPPESHTSDPRAGRFAGSS